MKGRTHYIMFDLATMTQWVELQATIVERWTAIWDTTTQTDTDPDTRIYPAT